MRPDEITFALWVNLLDRGWDGALAGVFERLRDWHAEQGTRGADRIVWRQTATAGWLAEGLTEREVADRIGVPLRTVQRDKALLGRLYDVGRRSSGLREAA